MAVGSIRKRGDRYYVRTRARVIDDDTGEARWQQVEKAAGSSVREAERRLRDLQVGIDVKQFTPARITVLELGHRAHHPGSPANAGFSLARSSGSAAALRDTAWAMSQERS